MPVSELKTHILSLYKSEADFARQIGWPRQRLNKITNGAKIPDVDEIAVLAKGLNLSISKTAQFFLRKQSPNG